jgi:hypothetical protein
MIILYPISYFMCKYLLFKNCNFHFCASLHFSNIQTTLLSSPHIGHLTLSSPLLLPLNFHVPNINHDNQGLLCELHCYIYFSLSHSCLMFQYKARYTFFSNFSFCLWAILHLVLIVWHAFFNSFPSVSNRMHPRPIWRKSVNGPLIYCFTLRDGTTVFGPSI